MGFYDSRSGMVIDGSEENAFTQTFEVIPNGTTAIAMVKTIIKKTIDNYDKFFYEITWKIVEGDFKNQEVKQKLKLFDEEPQKADRAVNMLVRIYNICSYKPAHDNAPMIEDLVPLIGKLCGIKIQEWSFPKEDGTFAEGNWVSEVHAPDANFKAETAPRVAKVKRTPPESMLTRNVGKTTFNGELIDDDILF